MRVKVFLSAWMRKEGRKEVKEGSGGRKWRREETGRQPLEEVEGGSRRQRKGPKSLFTPANESHQSHPCAFNEVCKCTEESIRHHRRMLIVWSSGLDPNTS